MRVLVWRLYRGQAAITVLVLAAFAAVLVVTGLSMAAQWHTLLLGCAANGSCGDLGATVSLGGSVAGHDLVISSLAAPAVFGMLAGSPLLAHEFEARTTDFAWSQSVTRIRWLLVKAGWTLLAAVWGAVIAALVTWWSGPRNALLQNALLRRTLPAITIALGGFIAARVLIAQDLRLHYMTPVTAFYSLAGNVNPPSGSWVLGGGIIGKSGQLVSGSLDGIVKGVTSASSLPAACQNLITGGRFSLAESNAVASCLQHAGFRAFTTYQPADRFWAFQGIETGIFVALSLVLLAVTYVVITRRDA